VWPLISPALCQENVRDEFLWIAIVKRIPAALHLHHHAMAFLEGVIVRAQTIVYSITCSNYGGRFS